MRGLSAAVSAAAVDQNQLVFVGQGGDIFGADGFVGDADGAGDVQLGVFRSEANAIALKKRFIETLGDKIGSEVSTRSTNGSYKVVAGKSMTEQQAKSAVAIIRDALNIKAFTLKE